MRAPAALGRMQARAESLMTATCEITRDDPAPALNEATLTYDSTSTLVYVGKCRVRGSVQAVPRDAGDQFTIADRASISLPVSAEGVREGDLVTITEAPDDPHLVGMAYRVRSLGAESQATALRLACEEA